MSFSGEFAAAAQALGSLAATTLAPALEVTLRGAAWNGTTAMNLSDRACSARGKHYENRIPQGGFSGVRRGVDLRAAGLASQDLTVKVQDPDDKLRDALLAYDQRFSTAVLYRVIPGSTDDYETIFTGVLDAWSFSPGEVQLTFRTDDRALRTMQPAWPALLSEWFHMALDAVGTYLPLAYGKIDSTGLGLTHGMIPTMPLWKDASSAWYGVCLGPANFIKDVYVSSGGAPAVKQTWTAPGAGGNAYEKVYGSLAGGKIVTMIEFNAGFFPADDDVVTADLYGYSAVNGSDDYTGLDVITNPVEAIRHFLVNFAIEKSRGYIPGAWSTLADIVDPDTFEDGIAYATAHGLEASRLLTDQQECDDVLREWCDSFLMFLPFWNSAGKIALAIFTMDWPGYWDGVSPVLSRNRDIGNSFRYSLETSDVCGKISVKYCTDYVEQKQLRTLDVTDPSSDELTDLSLTMPWQPARQV